MILHIVRGAYEVVEKVADESPGSDPDAGQVFVWGGAGLGALIFGSMSLDIVGGTRIPRRS